MVIFEHVSTDQNRFQLDNIQDAGWNRLNYWEWYKELQDRLNLSIVVQDYSYMA